MARSTRPRGGKRRPSRWARRALQRRCGQSRTVQSCADRVAWPSRESVEARGASSSVCATASLLEHRCYDVRLLFPTSKSPPLPWQGRGGEGRGGEGRERIGRDASFRRLTMPNAGPIPCHRPVGSSATIPLPLMFDRTPVTGPWRLPCPVEDAHRRWVTWTSFKPAPSRITDPASPVQWITPPPSKSWPAPSCSPAGSGHL